MKKLYSQFVTACVKPCLSLRKAASQNRTRVPLVTTVPVRAFAWPSIVVRSSAQAATRWIE